MIMYLGFIWPFRSDFLNYMEVFNELISLLLCYFMFCFTDWIPKADMRYNVGWVFIVVICTHLSVHLVSLIRQTCIELKKKGKEKIPKLKFLKKK